MGREWNAARACRPEHVWRGRPYPRGAGGMDPASISRLFPKHAERWSWSCSNRRRRELERVELRDSTDFVCKTLRVLL